MRHSVAIATKANQDLVAHLDRADGQEDLCFALYHESAGHERSTSLISEVVLPGVGERHVHGNVAFTSEYFLRSLDRAEEIGAGLALLHSHPGGRGWQDMSPDDVAAELGHAAQALVLTGRPFLGLTLATGDESWSARVWPKTADGYERHDCATVRVVGERLAISHHPRLSPVPVFDDRIKRTVSVWGPDVQADLARLRVGVVGLGSVGSMVAEALARTGFGHLVLMDFDSIEQHNLDRVLHATARDVASARSKVEVVAKALRRSATNPGAEISTADLSVTEPDGWLMALDCDVIFSCVDRPWPRHLLNLAAYAHLIPVVDGGIRAESRHGRWIGADWKAHVAAPTRRCLQCLRQYDPAHVTLEREGLLDDPSYISGLPANHPLRARENVFAFSMNAASLEVLQMISMVAAPQGIADFGGQSYHAVTGDMDHDMQGCHDNCPYRQELVGVGGTAPVLTGTHALADSQRGERATRAREWRVRLRRLRQDVAERASG